MTTRTAARDAALRRGRALTSSATVLALGATGAVLGVLSRPPAAAAPTARPEAAYSAAVPAPAVPQPKWTVYVTAPAVAPVGRAEPRKGASSAPHAQPSKASKASKGPVLTPVVRPPTAPPKPVKAPPATTSSGS